MTSGATLVVMTFVGIDGCAKGWIAVVRTETGATRAHYLATVAAVTDVIAAPIAIAIDIPIGLPVDGWRKADMLGRAMLGPRRHSLFLTHPHAVLAAETHAVSTALAAERMDAGISQQSYALRSKIFEVAAWLPNAPGPAWEAHPELSFSELLDHPALHSKKTWGGMTERRAALERAGIVVDDVSAEAARHAAVDDMLDAAVLSWTAQRIHEQTAYSIPSPPEQIDGRPIAIWV